MKFLSLLSALLAATPALAHEGVHLHPHGLITGLGLLAGTVALAALIGARK